MSGTHTHHVLTFSAWDLESSKILMWDTFTPLFVLWPAHLPHHLKRKKTRDIGRCTIRWQLNLAIQAAPQKWPPWSPLQLISEIHKSAKKHILSWFMHIANSLIPARLGVRWYNTTRYTLKYWSQCNSCDGGCSAGGITLFSVAIHECWAKLWSLHRVRASLTTAVLSQMQSPYMKRLCTACYRWYTLRTPHICDFAQSVESRCRFWRCNGLKQWVN